MVFELGLWFVVNSYLWVRLWRLNSGLLVSFREKKNLWHGLEESQMNIISLIIHVTLRMFLFQMPLMYDVVYLNSLSDIERLNFHSFVLVLM